MSTILRAQEAAMLVQFMWFQSNCKEQEMFSQVVYKIDDHKYKVEGTNDLGDKNKTTYYTSVEAMPADLRDKVKQLMWTSKNDQSITEELGVRIGENIFWII
jgi:hypothetical protein